jgi:hypothetical protein
MKADLMEDERWLDPLLIPESDRGKLLSLDQVLPMLVSPDTKVRLSRSADGRWLEAPGERFPIIDGLPLLYPARVQPHAQKGQLEIPPGGDDPLAKYLYISGLKHFNEPTNSEHTDINYLKHVHRARELLSDASGTVLDIGCDDPEISRGLFPSCVSYVGLEPTYADRSQFRIIGIAEFLPFRDETFDNVAVLTSLDHILDYHTAIDEARRVLRPGGTLFLATLVWVANAQLFNDHIHFHHFRDFEIKGVLRDFTITSLRRYTWKGNSHRFVWYLSATK